MKLEMKLPPKVISFVQKLKGYAVLIFFVALIGIYGFLVYQINVLTSTEPDEDMVTERLQGVRRPKVDEKAVEALQQLEASNIEVQTIFQQARDNPFGE